MLLAILVGVLILGGLPGTRLAEGLTTSVLRSGRAGLLIFMAVYFFTSVLGLPAAPLTVLGGALFGPWVGTLVVSIASVAGAIVSFLLGRGFLRGSVLGKLRAHPRLALLDAAVRKEGWRLVALLRLSPVVPFSLLNYALGATSISLLSYGLTTAVTVLPATFTYASLGSVAGHAAGFRPAHPGGPLAIGLGLLATAWAMIRLSKLTREPLAKVLPATVEGGS